MTTAARGEPVAGERGRRAASPLLRRIRRTLLALILPSVVVAIWWLATALQLIPKAFLPPPQKVLGALIEWVTGVAVFGDPAHAYAGTWLESVFSSGERVLAGYTVGAVIGIVLGGLLGYFASLRLLVEPTIHMLRAIPIIGWLPLSLVFFGLGIQSAIFLVALGVVFPVIVNAMAGVRGANPALLRVGQMAGANTFQLIRHIIVPSALPAIFTGLRVAMGFAWILVIVAEWMAVRTGLGFTLLDSYNFLRYDYVIAAMISVGLMGFVSDRILALLFRPILRWHFETTIEGQ
jgi:ABC-type nitrate/sulfonate/bicarbonate transport system permease component